ncbi:hypothetical protein R3I93_014951 [Phoxinus phoxinus]|uniref:Uncharacterized protein n=1 Tax=Phoxinus phoxinus TaxID=58324 RepID=A0AAN9CUA4_9TELE
MSCAIHSRLIMPLAELLRFWRPQHNRNFHEKQP